MNTLIQTASTATPAFLEWFHTPARAIAGGLGLLIILVVLFVIVQMIPDAIRYLRMSRM
jgi:heme A synthase